MTLLRTKTASCGRSFVWAALDCTSGFGVFLDKVPFALLGRFAAELTAPVEAGNSYVAVGWPLGAEGRKFYGGSALFTEDGKLCGVAKATWVKIKKKRARR